MNIADQPVYSQVSNMINDAVCDGVPFMCTGRLSSQDIAALYALFAEKIYAYCYVVLDDERAAEDATHDVFRKILTTKQPDRIESLQAWVFRIARTTLLDLHRYNQIRPQIQPINEVIIELPSSVEGPEEVAIAAVIRCQLKSAINLLSKKERAVIQLDLVDLSGPAIAEVLGISNAAVRMLRHRAIKHLTELMAEGE